MKLRKIKQRQLTLFKRHAFKRFLAKIDAGGYYARSFEDDSFWLGITTELTQGETA